MVKPDSSDFNPLSALSVRLKQFSTQLSKSVVQKPIASGSLLVVLGLGGVSWLATTAIAPQKVQAYTARVDVSLNRQSDESYESFLRRAEAVARAAAQRSFDTDILVSDVAVTILGQNNGAIAPVLLLQVSRQAWRSSPDPQRWATYFPGTQTLLGIENPETQLGTEPTALPATAEPPPFPPPASAPPTVIQTPGEPIPIQTIPPTPPPPALPPPEVTPVPQPQTPGAIAPQPATPASPAPPPTSDPNVPPPPAQNTPTTQ